MQNKTSCIFIILALKKAEKIEKQKRNSIGKPNTSDLLVVNGANVLA